MPITIESPEVMHELGVTLGAALRPGDLVLLTGPLGAGKTTLTRGIGEGMRVRGAVTSPTFVIARTHPSLVQGAPLVHVDAYRLGDATELDDLDIDLERSVVVAEWGADKFVNTHESWIEIVIERPAGSGDTGAETDDLERIEPRTLNVHAHGPRWSAEALSQAGLLS